jgi:hypothetical protein
MTGRAIHTRVRRNGRVFYWDGGSLTFFQWGVHLRQRQPESWRQHRLAFFARKSEAPGYVKFIDYSVRDTKTATSKPLAPCWRFWVGVKVGRYVGKSPYYEEAA